MSYDTMILNAYVRNEFVLFENGFFYYDPKNDGAMTAHELRAYADELDRLNKSRNDKINAYVEEDK